jgi:hypothetical protein
MLNKISRQKPKVSESKEDRRFKERRAGNSSCLDGCLITCTYPSENYDKFNNQMKCAAP